MGHGKGGSVARSRAYFPFMKPHPIRLEISGPTALCARPDTLRNPLSCAAPTSSAAKGIFEAILRRKARPASWACRLRRVSLSWRAAPGQRTRALESSA